MTYIEILRSFAESSPRDEVPVGVRVTYGAIRQGLAEAEEIQADLNEAERLLSGWIQSFDAEEHASWADYIAQMKQNTEHTRAFLAKRGKKS